MNKNASAQTDNREYSDFVKRPKADANRYAYWLIVFFLTLTGFGQMPIFSRYYIADIPGLGWLGEFYITHFMHYLFALALISFSAYWATDFWLQKRRMSRLTVSGRLRVRLLLGLMATGGLLVFRNLTGTGLSHNFIIFLNLAHLSLVMALLITGACCLALKKPWVNTVNNIIS